MRNAGRSSLSDDPRPLHVYKFGGTSLGSGLRRVVQIVREAATANRLIVVASALAGVTDRLVQAADEGQERSTGCTGALAAYHMGCAAAMLDEAAHARYQVFVNVHLEALARLLALPEPRRHRAWRDAVLATGERLAAPLVAAVLEAGGVPSLPVDATSLIRTDARHGAANVAVAETYRQIRAWHDGLPSRVVPVVTGFLGATSAGATTTLGRGGTDYTAALLTAALGARLLTRWTDVNGLYTADPRRHAAATRMRQLTLDEALPKTRDGQFGMHWKALDPLVQAGIPLCVRSTLQPEHEGTWVMPDEGCAVGC